MQTNIKNEEYFKHIVQMQESENNESAMKLSFPVIWKVWVHSNKSSDWTLKSYHNILEIKNVYDMWEFLNNFNNLDYMDYQFFVMKNDIKPFWEDPMNINGGAASIRVKLSEKSLLKIWEDLCIFTFNEQICNNPEWINGISFNLKNDIVVMKIWNTDISNDLSKMLSKEFVTKYDLKGIVYIKNRPAVE